MLGSTMMCAVLALAGNNPPAPAEVGAGGSGASSSSSSSSSGSSSSSSSSSSIVAVRNVTFSCNTSDWGPAPTYCVNSEMAQYLPLSGKYFGHDVRWERFPEARNWRLGDGLTFSDDIPLCCNMPPSVGEQKLNHSSCTASIQHYRLATTYCNWGMSGGDSSYASIAEWGYDWYATSVGLRKRVFLYAPFYILQTIISPRQARDRDKESLT